MPSSLVHKIRIGRTALFDDSAGAARAVLSGYTLGGKPVVFAAGFVAPDLGREDLAARRNPMNYRLPGRATATVRIRQTGSNLAPKPSTRISNFGGADFGGASRAKTGLCSCAADLSGAGAFRGGSG
jgi:hypothetical protein